MRAIWYRNRPWYILGLLLPVALAFIIMGSVFMGSLDFYESSSQKGILVDSYVSVRAGKQPTYTVQQIFSYDVTVDGHSSIANCTRAATTFSKEKRAQRSSKAVIRGTSRALYLSRAVDNDSCIDQKTRNFCIQMAMASFTIVAAWVSALSIACFLRATHVYPEQSTVHVARSQAVYVIGVDAVEADVEYALTLCTAAEVRVVEMTSKSSTDTGEVIAVSSWASTVACLAEEEA
jgi:hypothetical protein